MKTAVSIPDGIFESAERVARRMGVSRSELYANALRQYLDKHAAEQVTRHLDEVYGDDAQPMDPALIELQRRSLPREAW